jgi:hypothetical protein
MRVPPLPKLLIKLAIVTLELHELHSCILAYAFFALKFVSTMHNVFLCIKVLLCCLQMFCVFVFKVHNFKCCGFKGLGVLMIQSWLHTL